MRSDIAGLRVWMADRVVFHVSAFCFWVSLFG